MHTSYGFQLRLSLTQRKSPLYISLIAIQRVVSVTPAPKIFRKYCLASITARVRRVRCSPDQMIPKMEAKLRKMWLRRIEGREEER